MGVNMKPKRIKLLLELTATLSEDDDSYNISFEDFTRKDKLKVSLKLDNELSSP